MGLSIRWRQVVALVVIALAPLTGACQRGDDVGSGQGCRPTEFVEVRYPAAERQGRCSLTTYLDQRGAPLLVMHERAREVTPSITKPQCRTMISALDAAAPADQVQGIAAGVNDVPLRGAFQQERLTLGVSLTVVVLPRTDPCRSRSASKP